MKNGKNTWKSSKLLKTLYVLGMCFVGAMIVIESNGLNYALSYNDGELKLDDKTPVTYSYDQGQARWNINYYLWNTMELNHREGIDEFQRSWNDNIENMDVKVSFYNNKTNKWEVKTEREYNPENKKEVFQQVAYRYYLLDDKGNETGYFADYDPKDFNEKKAVEDGYLAGYKGGKFVIEKGRGFNSYNLPTINDGTKVADPNLLNTEYTIMLEINEDGVMANGEISAVPVEDDGVVYLYDQYNDEYVGYFEDPTKDESLKLYDDGSYVVSIEKRDKGQDTEEAKKPEDYKNIRFVKVVGTVYEPLIYNDLLKYDHAMFDKYIPYTTKTLSVLISYCVAMVVLLVLSFTSAGHKKNVEGFHTNAIDRVPFGLFILPFIMFVAGVDRMGVNHSYITATISFEMASFIVVAMIISLYILMVSLSFARRIKAKKFFKSTCIYWIWVLLVKIFKFFLSGINEMRFAKYTYSVFFGLPILALFSITTGSPFFIIVAMIAYIYVVLKLGTEFKKIEEAGEEIANGNLDFEIKPTSHTPKCIVRFMDNLMSIRNGINVAIQKELKSERMKTELITNVSHDIKTPLTSIINYSDLLQKEHTEEQEKEYLEVLSRQSNRLKKLIEDLIEASKASTGNLKVNLMPMDLKEIIDQATAEYYEKFEAAKIQPVIHVENPPISVIADGRLLWRVLSNLYSNATKYAMPRTRLYVDAKRINENEAMIEIKNISKEPLNISPDELLERFVRGDESRTGEGGSGLGLDIANSLTQLMHGKFNISIEGDLFKVVIILPLNTQKTPVFKDVQLTTRPVVVPSEFEVKEETKVEEETLNNETEDIQEEVKEESQKHDSTEKENAEVEKIEDKEDLETEETDSNDE